MFKGIEKTEKMDVFAAEAALTSLRWGDRISCPRCLSTEGIREAFGTEYNLRKKRILKVWHCNSCQKWFSVLNNTLFQGASHKLPKWIDAVKLLYLDTSMSSYELGKKLKIHYITAGKIRSRILPFLLKYQNAGIPLSIEEVFKKMLSERGEPAEFKPEEVEKPPRHFRLAKGFTMDEDVVEAVEKEAVSKGVSYSYLVSNILRKELITQGEGQTNELKK